MNSNQICRIYAKAISQFKVQLKRQVSRNLKHFPSDFIFELTRDEHHILKNQIGTL
ncbi:MULTISPECIES: ORF6N domain-containing protein [unclassified Sphingobacterium]|uniref:ORF6N domain-containing protein n=1 Tax=unclassified Sphingobacterium TaxID=2609468 RepID=UPI0010491AAE|nr:MULTISPECIES: ORF6N domain-containing protein [unclassified Sphingobacterium]